MNVAKRVEANPQGLGMNRSASLRGTCSMMNGNGTGTCLAARASTWAPCTHPFALTEGLLSLRTRVLLGCGSAACPEPRGEHTVVSML